MESDLQQHHRLHDHHQQQQQQQMNSGLTRYRSAPSSFFTDVLDREFCQQFFNRPSSPETERIFARFMNSSDDPPEEDSDPPKASIVNQVHNQNQQQSSNNNMGVNYSPPSPAASFYQSNLKPPLPSQGMSSGNDVSYSMGVNTQLFPAMRTGGVNNSNLIRHSSSPAGLFSNINIDTGFGAMRGMGTYGASSNSTANEEASFSPPSRLKRTSSTGPMSPIAEIDDKSMVGTNNHDNSNYMPSFPMGSWDDSAIIPDNMTGLKRLRDDDVKRFSGLNHSETQDVEAGKRPPMLAHHLSLPKTSTEMAAIEKFLQFQDSVPCKIRAKRGCATHPRSIAERVRRTKISERMRKLQDLVPNMEKQTNTADMLDLAVEYIKDLQSRVQTLTDSRAKCTCSNKQQSQQKGQCN